jgi:CheY-like chemotaxis protein
VLIAVADADTRELYRECLRTTGCDVIDAVDGRDALVSALVHRPSLVITDSRLPIFDGYQLLDVLRRDALTGGVPVLVLTAESRDSELQRARKSGADSVLVKPISPDALLREVQRLLNQNPELDRPSGDTASPRRQAKARRTNTLTTEAAPPVLMCPRCDRPLNYEHSDMGGVRNLAEQWDTFACPSCGLFEYRHRTRQLRKLA